MKNLQDLIKELEEVKRRLRFLEEERMRHTAYPPIVIQPSPQNPLDPPYKVTCKNDNSPF